MSAREALVDSELPRKVVHRLFTLRKHLQHLQPLWAGYGFADSRDLLIELILDLTSAPTVEIRRPVNWK